MSAPSEVSRRAFLVGVSGGALVIATGCGSGKDDSANSGEGPPKPVSSPASPKEALAQLLLLVGPWAARDRKVAEEFFERYLREERLASLSGHHGAIESLLQTLPEKSGGELDAVDLEQLSSAEEAALLAVVTDLYAVEEVRFYIAQEPPAGTCIGDVSVIQTPPTGTR